MMKKSDDFCLFHCGGQLKMKKLIFLFLILILLLIGLVSATVYETNNVFDGLITGPGTWTNGDTPITNVGVFGVICSDSNCNNIQGNLWNGVILNTGSDNQIQLTYSSTQQGYMYGVYYVKEGWIPFEGWSKWSGNGNKGPFERNLYKKQVCISNINSFDLSSNSINEGQTVYINSNVKAPIDNFGDLNYIPSQIANYYKVGVKVLLEIKRNGNLIYTEYKNFNMDFSGNQNVVFNWTPQNIVTSGTYEISIITTVPDAKCLSSTEQKQTKTLTVNVICTPNWQTGSWGSCVNNIQTRTVTDLNNCGINTGKPATTQSCTPVCDENWNCGSWGSCVNSLQTRTCNDLNSCGTVVNKPATSQSCVMPCIPNWITGNWGSCVNNIQTRLVTDLNNCGVNTNKPANTQSCSCIPNWQVGSWGLCSNGIQSRPVTDLNNCGVNTGKPANTQSCTIICNSKTDCGQDGYVGTPNCNNNDLFQNYRTYICNNAGTTQSSCSYNDVLQLKQDCGVNILGTFGNNYCKYGNVYHSRTNTNRGCSNNICFSNNVVDEQLYQTCSYGCTNGVCNNPVCIPNWITGNWGSCVNNIQTRTVVDSNNCNDNTNKPATSQSCVMPCVPNWQVGSWGNCVNGIQSRPVTDLNNCGVNTNKPSTTQSCTPVCDENWNCGSWGSCINSLQTRTCTDLNNCGTINNKPATSQSCTCTPNWQVGIWGNCINNIQTRLVTDLNNCGVNTGKPATSQSCTIVCNSKTDCGQDGYVGTPNCNNNDLFQNYRTYICNNAGTTQSSCSYNDVLQLKQDCEESSLGTFGANYCKSGDVYKSRTNIIKGCSINSCTSKNILEQVKVEDCAYGCSNGACKPKNNETCVDESNVIVNFCGDNICDQEIGEDSTSCPEDCKINNIINLDNQADSEKAVNKKSIINSNISLIWIILGILIFIILLVLIVYYLIR